MVISTKLTILSTYREHGVAFLVNKKCTKYVEGYEAISDTLIRISFNSKPVKLHIVQVYLPTTDHSDDEVEAEYEKLERAILNLLQKDLLIVTGDFYAKIEE